MADPTTVDNRPVLGGPAQPVAIMNSQGMPVLLYAANGQPLLFANDATDRLRVSLYGKNAAAGDMALVANAIGGLSVEITRIGGNNTTVPTDGMSPPSGIPAFVFQEGYNGSLWDKWRNNNDLIPLASAARTVLTNSPDQTNYNARAVRIDIDVTLVAGSPSLVFSVQTKDTLSGVYTTVLTATAIVATGHVQLLVGNGVTTVANLAQNCILGRFWRVVCTPGTADSCTYSVSASSNN